MHQLNGSCPQPVAEVQCPLDSSQRSASIEAMHPVPAAVTAWRYMWSTTSPAANTPSTLVRVSYGDAGSQSALRFVPATMYPAGSSSSLPWNSELLGVCPIATKMPPASITVTSSVSRLRSLAPWTLCSPSTSSMVEFHTNEILSLAMARSCMIFEARSWSRRWITDSLEAKRWRNRASSMAESPPPTTRSSWFLKKAPSQVAQVETPLPSR